MKKNILSIDTSCDETSVAVTEGYQVLANVIASQVQLHKQYGGVFPTVAKQAHQQNLAPAIKATLKRAGKTWAEIDAIAVTQGPGLAPALEIGLKKAKALGEKYGKPVIPVNHIEGHILAVLARPKNKKDLEVKLPALAVVVSGGHTEFVLVKKLGEYQRLGMTVDDAAGECLDKVGRLLGLGYPAGPVVEKLAKQGDETSFPFPLPMTDVKNFNLSFSGLKTHSKRLIKELELDKKTTANFCASLQAGVLNHIVYKLEKLLADTEVKELWLGGGVAANVELRKKLRAVAKKHQLTFRVPYTKKLCGDNAAMIGLAAMNREAKGNLDRRPRWAIDQN